MLIDRAKPIDKLIILGVIHIPPFLPPFVETVDEKLIQKVEDYICSELEVWAGGGVHGVFLQNGYHYPKGQRASAETIALMTRFALAAKGTVDLPLGLILEEHDPEGLLGVARAVPLDFIRVKVYMGAMVKSDGIITGCAGELYQKQWELNLCKTTNIFADIYDRTGQPLAPLELEEMCRQAVEFGNADGLILTGHTFQESIAMLARVKKEMPAVPLLLGGSSTRENLAESMKYADGCVLYSSVIDEDESAPRGWGKRLNPQKLKEYMEVVERLKG